LEARVSKAETSKSAAIPACLFALMVPGAGHVYLGRRGKGLLLFAAVGALFAMGVAMNAQLQIHLGFEDILASLFSLSQMAAGLLYVVARALGFELGVPTSVTYEYGNTFTAVAGLLNVLLIMDAYDTAVGRKP
jgi:hypothetical protein